MLFADSYVLPRKRAGGRRHGRRRWVKLRVHARRLANIGANASELRGLVGGAARVCSWLLWFLWLLWSLVLRGWNRVYRFGCRLLDGFLDWLRAQDRVRWELYQHYTHLKSLTHRRQRGRTAPILLMASATVLIISACYFGLGFQVRLDGQPIGYVEDRSQVDALVERVEERLSAYLGVPYSLEADFSYSMRYMDRTDPLDEELLEQWLFASVGDVSRRYVLTVDGETIGACQSKTALELMLRRILLDSAGNATQVNTSFVNDVRITETTSSAAALVPLADMEARLTANKTETQTYTVQSGDTVSAIGLRYDMKVSEIKALNPGLNEARIHVGQQLTLSAAVPYLSVQQTVTEAYTQVIPYETVIQYDDTMYKNKSKITVQGVNGSADVVADVTYVNGVETGREIISYVVTSEPVNAVKVVGSKPLPRTMATGNFIKPSNGTFSSALWATSTPAWTSPGRRAPASGPPTAAWSPTPAGRATTATASSSITRTATPPCTPTAASCW